MTATYRNSRATDPMSDETRAPELKRVLALEAGVAGGRVARALGSAVGIKVALAVILATKFARDAATVGDKVAASLTFEGATVAAARLPGTAAATGRTGAATTPSAGT